MKRGSVDEFKLLAREGFHCPSLHVLAGQLSRCVSVCCDIGDSNGHDELPIITQPGPAPARSSVTTC